MNFPYEERVSYLFRFLVFTITTTRREEENAAEVLVCVCVFV